MRRFGLILAIVALVVPLGAQQRATTYQQLTVDNTAAGVAISNATLFGMSACQGVLETAQIRVRCDGTAPSTTVGTPVDPGGTIDFAHIIDARACRFIRTTGTNGTLNINCWPAF